MSISDDDFSVRFLKAEVWGGLVEKELVLYGEEGSAFSANLSLTPVQFDHESSCYLGH
jgi:hypothetical protein